MNTGLLLILILAIVAVVGYLVVREARARERERAIRDELDRMETKLAQSLKDTRSEIVTQFTELSKMLEQQIRGLQSQFETTDKKLYTKLQDTQKVVLQVSRNLGTVQQITRQMLEISKDIQSLQDLLRPPKLRGELGELFLENLLQETLPRDHYAVQYRFRDGTIVDAAIFLSDQRIVPVDSKFPMESFTRMQEAQTDEEKKRFRREFIRDVQRHIQAIAQKYIKPTENTMDFAMMYIPAEAVYYEAMVRTEGRQDLFNFALKHKVIPVSPNTFYSYLATIVLGLKGFQLERKAEQVIRILADFQQKFEKVKEDFRVLGGHLENAQKKYDEARKKLERIDMALSGLSQGVLPHGEETHQ